MDAASQCVSVLCSGISGYPRTRPLGKNIKEPDPEPPKKYMPVLEPDPDPPKKDSSKIGPRTARWFESVLKHQIGPASFVKKIFKYLNLIKINNLKQLLVKSWKIHLQIGDPWLNVYHVIQELGFYLA